MSPAEIKRLTKIEKVESSNGSLKEKASLNLSDIYDAQKFNATPELVKTPQDLFKRTDVLMHKDGINVTFFRGVGVSPDGDNFLDQFQGKGKNGSKHFAGSGIYGNGTYSVGPRGSSWDNISQAYEEALSYTMGAGGGSIDADIKMSPGRVTMFGIKKIAKILDLTTDRGFDHDSFRNAAQRLLKTKVDDVGELAAALGFEVVKTADNAGYNDQDFWIVLNRSALVTAEGGMTNHEPKRYGSGESGMADVKLTKKMSEEKLNKPIEAIDYKNPDALVNKWKEADSGEQSNAVLANITELAPNAGSSEIRSWKARNLEKFKKIKEDMESIYAEQKAKDPYSPETEIYEAMLESMNDF
jgi:hypothetical protein